MTTVKELEKLNKIDQTEFEKVTHIVFHSFLLTHPYKTNSFLDKKEELINYFSSFLVKYLELDFTNSKKSKLELINFIDKLNMQKELLEIAKNDVRLSDIKVAAKRLGKKSQSAFETKSPKN